ncbi:hypothetical protein [Weissella confusa]|uniref:hypothetical protein n=1 Tax=Weissella confusa TaxID=1583 RepID=UPI00223BD99E|nr:hypothetical protein [Weissella confusa]MCS9991234.1 hypothetical protein [Weissella confusa]
MEHYQFSFVANMLQRYPNFDLEIKRAEYEALHDREVFVDENVGGGRAQYKESRSIEMMAIKLADNLRIKRLKMNQETIRIALESADPDTYSIIHDMYLVPYSTDTLESMALKLSSSRPVVSRKRAKFFETIYTQLFTV